MPIQQISEKSIFALVIDYYYLCNKNCLIREYRCKHREGSVSKSLPLILFSSDYQIYILDSHFCGSKQINDKYRRYRADIEKALSDREMFTDYDAILQPRKSEIGKVAAEISRIQSSGLAVPTIDELLGSISHMTMNRWFRTNNRQFELVIYDFLTKYFESAIARTKRLVEKQ